MLHYYKWNRANKKSFAERPGVERWAGPSLFWFVLSEWCIGGSLLRRAWWGGSPASSAANGLTPSFQPFLLLLFCCDEQVCGCFGCLPWPAWGRTMKNGKNSKAQAWGPLAFLPCPCLSMSLFSWAFGEPIMPGDSERSLSLKPAKSDVLMVSEPILVGTGSAGSLPARVFLREPSSLPFCIFGKRVHLPLRPSGRRGGWWRRRRQGPLQVAESRGLRRPQASKVGLGVRPTPRVSGGHRLLGEVTGFFAALHRWVLQECTLLPPRGSLCPQPLPASRWLSWVMESLITFHVLSLLSGSPGPPPDGSRSRATA